MKVLYVCWLMLLVTAESYGHGGGLNTDRCHNNSNTGTYHCHQLPLSIENNENGHKFDRIEYGFRSYKPSSNIGFYTQEVCAKVHIDHVVSLKDAHDSGAKYWSINEKKMFANDRVNHVISCSYVNMSKSNSLPKDFLRKSSDGVGRDYVILSFCTYLDIYYEIKNKYNLDVVQNDLTLIELCR